MTSICLVRHGETDWNKAMRVQGTTDIPLNQTGREQAEEAREFLEESDWDILITSPLSRARQTAEIINKYMQMPIVEMDVFKERGYGDAEGLTPEERQQQFPGLREYPNQEPKAAVTKRVLEGMDEILKSYPDKHVLLVAHGGVINSILAHLSGGELGSGKTKLVNACLSNIHYEDGNWRIKNYNQVDHLKAYAAGESFK